jgi:hypothetical protein
MEAKFPDCVEQVFDRSHAVDLLAQLRSFDRCTNIAGVMGSLARSEQAGKQKVMRS